MQGVGSEGSGADQSMTVAVLQEQGRIAILCKLSMVTKAPKLRCTSLPLALRLLCTSILTENGTSGVGARLRACLCLGSALLGGSGLFLPFKGLFFNNRGSGFRIRA